MKRFGFLVGRPWVQALAFVGTFVFGLLVGPLLENLTASTLSDANRVIMAGIVLVAFLILVLINTVLAFQTVNMEKSKTANEALDTIARRMGLTVEYLSDKDESSSRDAYSVVRDLANFAKNELLILDHRPAFASDRFYDQTPPESLSRTLYYELLGRKALSRTATGGYFRYKRIVQLDEGPTNKWDTLVNRDLLFAEHCRKIVAFRNSTPKAVASISTSRVFFPKSSIIIADAERVLIELAIVGPDGKTKVAGDLVFSDPQGELARPLKELFDHIDAQSTLITEVKDQ